MVMSAGRLKLASTSQNVTFIVEGAPIITGATVPTQTLWIRGSGSVGDANASFPEGFVNGGTLRLQSAVSNFASNLSIAAGQTLINNGTLESLVGSSGGRLITGAVVNNGLFDVKLNTTWAGSLTNNGTVNIAAGQRLTHSGNSVFNNTAGAVNNLGTLEIRAGSVFNQLAGAVTGNAISLITTKLVLAGGGSGAFLLSGNCTLEGDIAAGQSVWVNGNGSAGDANLSVATSFTNNGSLRIESAVSNFASTMTVNGGTFTNAASVLVGAGSGGSRVITGAVTNNGTVDFNLNTSWAGTFTNNGTVNVATNQKLTNSGTQSFNQNGGAINVTGAFEISSTGTLNYNGGTITGTPVNVLGGRLNLAGTGAGSFILQGASIVQGTIAAGQTVWVNGNGSRGDANVSAPSGLTNEGLLRIESSVSNFASNFNVTGTLTNNGTGTVEINQGSSGSRVLGGSVVNRGVFDVKQPATFTGASFDNSTGGKLRGTSSFTLSSPAATLTNSGSIAPGLSPGTLTVTRATQLAAGSVDVEIAALTSFDRLAVTGALTLDGALNITLLNGYVPNLGDTFDVVTFGTRSGAFAALNGASIGGGKKFQVTYGTTFVRLTVVAE
jgi:hypothetical protein